MSDPQAITRGRTWDNPIVVSGDNGDWTFPQWDAPFGLIDHGSYTGYGHLPAEVFTGGGYWSTEGVSANHPYLELPSTQGPYTISSYSLLASPDQINGGEVIDGVAYARVQPNAAYPAAWQLLGSNDGGTSWTVIDSRSGQDTGAFAPNPNEPTTMMAVPRTYQLSAPVTFTRFKFVVTAIPANAADTATGGGTGSQPPIDRCYLESLYFNETPWQDFAGQYHFHLTGLTPFARYDLQSVATFCDGITLATYSHPDGVGSYEQARDLVSTLGIVTDELWVQMDFTTGTRHVGGEDFQMSSPDGVGSFMLQWGRSVDANGVALPAAPAGNYRWEVAQEIDVAAPGSTSYDGNVDPAFRTSWGGVTRWWKFQATERGTVTFLTDEPDSDWRGYADWDGGASLGEGYRSGPDLGQPLWVDVEPTHDGVDPSHSYYVEVFPLGQPGPASPYHLSWVFNPPPVTPYHVANDTPATAMPVSIGQVLGQTVGSFGYDNTGATEDPVGDKRSIWFSFSMPQTHYLTFKSTSTVFTSPEDQPSIAIRNADGSPASDQHNITDGLVLKAVGGTTYLLELAWPNTYTASPWDHGSVAWTVFDDIPNDTSSAPQVITFPDQQNLLVTNPIPGYMGSQWFKIVVPADGGLCQVVEMAPGTGAIAEIYQVYSDGSLTLVDTIPMRTPGSTIPALIIGARAGESYIVRIASSGPVTLRTGLSHDVTWGEWHSSDWRSYTSIDDGNYGVMSGPAGLQCWPPTDVGSEAGAGRYWSASDLIPASPSARPPDPAPIGAAIEAAAGGANAPAPVDAGNAHGPKVHWDGGQIFDPAHNTVRTEVHFGNTIFGCSASVVGMTDPIFASYPPNKAARLNPYSSLNLAPIFAGAGARLRELTPESAGKQPWEVTNEVGDWYLAAGGTFNSWLQPYGPPTAAERFARSLAVEWSIDNPTNAPRFDVFRAYSASWSKFVHGNGLGAPSYIPATSMIGTLVEISNVLPELGGMNPPAFMGPDVAGVEIATFSDASGGEASVVAGTGTYTPFDFVVDYGNTYWLTLDDRCRILHDVTDGKWPENTWTYTEAYGCASDLPQAIDYGEMAPHLVSLAGGQQGIGGEGICPGFSFDINWGVLMLTGRKYPDQYRVGKYAESFAPIGASTQTPAGAILRAVGDLAAVPGAVAVHFATT